MSEPLDVDPHTLMASSADIDGCSQSVFAAHSAADEAVDAALLGWVGLSREALLATAAHWASATTELTARLYEHSEGLRVSALSFAEMEEQHAAALDRLYRPR